MIEAVTARVSSYFLWLLWLIVWCRSSLKDCERFNTEENSTACGNKKQVDAGLVESTEERTETFNER